LEQTVCRHRAENGMGDTARSNGEGKANCRSVRRPESGNPTRFAEQENASATQAEKEQQTRCQHQNVAERLMPIGWKTLAEERPQCENRKLIPC
jgi:hypothetical protein